MAKKTVEENTVETTTEKTEKTAVETATATDTGKSADSTPAKAGKETAAKTPKKPATVYIGQSLPGLKQYTVFVGGELPEYVKQMIAEDENIAGLIVPVGELQTSRQNINKKGHRLNAFAEKVAEKLKAKKLKKED